MTPEDEWDVTVAEQPEHGRVRARLPWIGPEVLRIGGDEQSECVTTADESSAPGVADLAAAAAGFDLRQHAQDLERQVEALTASAAEPNLERDFYRDSLRRILGVTRTDGEALIALAEVRLRDADVQAADVCTAIEKHLGIQRTDPDETLHERLTRVGLVVIEVLDARRRADNRSKRWQTRARSAEAQRDAWRAVALNAERTIARLTEERDGLTLRLGAKVARQIAKREGG